MAARSSSICSATSTHCPIAGGTATRITSGIAFDAQPRWSPDGQSIAFVSDRSGAENVWIVDADGRNPHAITRDERTTFISPAWAPDGQYIVVSKSTEVITDYQLFMYHRSGSGSGVQVTGSAATAAAADPSVARPRSVLGVAFGGDPRSAGIFSIAFRDARHGVIAGGDYRQPALRGQNLALTSDGGATWTVVDSATSPMGFRSAVTFVPGTNGKRIVTVGLNGTDISSDGGRTWVAVDSAGYNAVSFATRTAGFAVGAKGSVAKFVEKRR